MTDTKQRHFLLSQHQCVLEQGRCCAHIRRTAGIDKRVEPCTKLLVSSAFCKSTHLLVICTRDNFADSAW